MSHMSNSSSSGIVFNIQRFSVHDGPGIRTTVFLKGCSLRCEWCQNPEGLHSGNEIQYFPELCINCGACAEVCKRQGHQIRERGHLFQREYCVACGACSAICFAEALRTVGAPMTVDQVMTEVLRDQPFYENSGGGITLSGGDPLLQPKFARAILSDCRKKQIHTALETAVNCRWESLKTFLPLTDLFLVDIKHVDTKKHFQATGAKNTRILANIERLAQTDKPIIIRVPVVPDFNDTEEDIAAISRFVHHLAESRLRGSNSSGNSSESISLELIAFHKLASGKYQSLGLDYRAADRVPLSGERMHELRQIAAQWGLCVNGYLPPRART